MKVKDKVKTHLSLWKGEIGTITGMIEDKAEHWVMLYFLKQISTMLFNNHLIARI
jgi:hypothetical protein